MSEITILHPNSIVNISLSHYCLYPIITSQLTHLFKITTDIHYCLYEDNNKYLLIARFFKHRYDQKTKNIQILTQLRERYKKIFFFDDSDGADSLHVELIDYVDIYYKKQLLKDKEFYFKPMYRRQFFSDYYHRQYGVIDLQEQIRKPLRAKGQLNKLRLAWNIGLGHYETSATLREFINPKNKRIKGTYNLTNLRHHVSDLCWLIPHRLNHSRSAPKKRNFIHARFDYQRYPPSIGYQRKLYLEQIRGKPRFRSGHVNPALYRLELRLAKAILSPFGYGEICFRDFEAILAHTLLLKPSMDHLETWPNIYIPGQTYIELDWNGHNLLPICEAILSNQIDVQNIQKNAYSIYQRSLSEIDTKIEEILDEFHC